MTRTPQDEKIIDRIFIMEGGATYTNRPADKGGPTKYGITQATLAKWRGRAVSPEDVKNLGEAEARDITYQKFIVEPGFSLLSDPDMRFAMVDFTFLFGADDSIPTLQRILNTRVDGVLGPGTAALANGADHRFVMNRLAVERIKLHAQRVVDDLMRRECFHGSQAENLRGWINRAAAFIT
jgi:lysozyme family protein